MDAKYEHLDQRGSGKLSSTTTGLTPLFPQPDLPLTPLSAGFENIDGGVSEYGLSSSHLQSVSDVLKSFTSSQRSTHSYELVEEDDYEPASSLVTPRQPKDMAAAMAVGRPSHEREDIPARTASISRNLPLHNPTPDLQSLQGAYVKNVQALEDSAERISLAASIEEELQRMKMDMRRSESLSRNSSSQHATEYTTRLYSAKSNSIIGVNATARTGGYSPAGVVTSPIGSVRSQRKVSVSQRASRMSKASVVSNVLPEPALEGRPLESAMVHSPPAHVMQPRQSTESQRSVSQGSLLDRPGTSASNDTYRQAQNLFTDFDGIHYSPQIEDDGFSRRISLSHPPRARDSRVFSQPQPDQHTIYYPAPVPVMLNLPKRLSQYNWAQQQKRRTIALNSIPVENRQSAIWLGNADTDAEHEEPPVVKRMSNIPSQLRASAFFDAPASRSDIKLKHGSAVITLDSILDAAAHAPVSAFTDHPIAGHLGYEVYGQEPRHKKKSSEHKQRRRSSLSNMLSNRKSTASLSGNLRLSRTLDNEVEIPEDDPERDGEKSLAPDADELVDEEDQRSGEEDEGSAEEEDEEEDEHQLGFLGAPTTLLAELQLRKAQQKLRNRTAANAFPTGMHATLLELDAVSQLQQKSRKQKHVALAWEDKEATDKANFEDEDVPLGVLFPEKDRQGHINQHRPLGLMEKKEMEENEPLSSRRARLRGEPYRPNPPAAPADLISEAPTAADRLEDHDDEEGETLAQRRKRMQETTNTSLADDIAKQLGIDPEQLGGTKTPEPLATGEEETLGQRRKRLQAEAEKNNTTALKPKTSMGDLLRANPVGSHYQERQASAESKVALLMNRRDNSKPFINNIQAQQPLSRTFPMTLPPHFQNPPSALHQQYQQYQQQQLPPQMYMPQMNAMQSMPNLHMMNSNVGSSMNVNHFGAPQHYPYNSTPQNMNMSNMSLGMMYNPLAFGMGAAMQMTPGGKPPGAPPYDAIGMGPPLNPQQRANIDTWRQSVL